MVDGHLVPFVTQYALYVMNIKSIILLVSVVDMPISVLSWRDIRTSFLELFAGQQDGISRGNRSKDNLFHVQYLCTRAHDKSFV